MIIFVVVEVCLLFKQGDTDDEAGALSKVALRVDGTLVSFDHAGCAGRLDLILESFAQFQQLYEYSTAVTLHVLAVSFARNRS